MSKGKASISATGASMSKYDVEVEGRLKALEGQAHKAPTGATQKKVEDRLAALEKAVADIAAKAVGKENVYIATDSEKISRVIETHGYNFIMTSSSCLTGTDRVSEAAKKIDSDIIINIQGDEPMLDPNDIISVIEEKKKYPNSVITCMANLSATEDPNDKKIPKIITDINNKLLYASRTAIPGSKNGTAPEFKKQVCIYLNN